MKIDCNVTVALIVRADKQTVSRLLRKHVGDNDGQWERLYYSFTDSWVPDDEHDPDSDGMGSIECHDLLQLACMIDACEEEKLRTGLSIAMQDKSGEPNDHNAWKDSRRGSAWARWSDNTFPDRRKDAEILLYPSAVESGIADAARKASVILSEALSGTSHTRAARPGEANR